MVLNEWTVDTHQNKRILRPAGIRYLRDSFLRPLAEKSTIDWTVAYNITIPSITGFLGYMVSCIYRRCRHDCGGLVVGQTRLF